MELSKTQQKYLDIYTKKYGNKYKYKPETIINSYTKIPIECDCGNLFYMSPYNHTRYGCPKCSKKEGGRKRSISQEDYINKCIQLYGDKYDLSETIYTGYSDKIKVICRIHGPFYISAIEFLRRHGCQKCVGNYQMSNEEYIEALKQVHGDRYDLSLVDFKGTKHRVIGICKDHGQFTLQADNFLKGGNCPQCARLIAIDKTKLSQEEVVQKFREIHGGRYGYRNFIYKGSMIKGQIDCEKHGPFLMSYTAHYSLKFGCPKCGIESASKAKEKTIEEKFHYFITKARKVHGDKNNYYIEDFTDSQDKTRITCKKHKKDYWQIASSHLRGNGCPICNESKGEKATAEILNKFNIVFTREYKIPGVKEKHNKEYEYDFHLTDYRILIEFHGIQHYEPRSFFNGKKEYERTIKRDFAKEVLAKAFNYKLIIIHYKHLEKGILEQYLKRQLIRYGVLPFEPL